MDDFCDWRDSLHTLAVRRVKCIHQSVKLSVENLFIHGSDSSRDGVQHKHCSAMEEGGG